MDDHFWPSMYPGIVVGLLYGLAVARVRGLIIGAIGGLAGAAIAYTVLTRLDAQEGFFSFAVTMGLAAVLAAVLIGIDQRYVQARERPGAPSPRNDGS